MVKVHAHIDGPIVLWLGVAGKAQFLRLIGNKQPIVGPSSFNPRRFS
jgi:hypothetical protein